MFKGLLTDPQFLMGASILGSRGNVGQGLLDYSRIQSNMTQNRLLELKLQEAQRVRDLQAAQRSAFGAPARTEMIGPPHKGQMEAQQVPASGMFSRNPAEVARAQMDVIRQSPDVGASLLNFQRLQAQKKQRDFGKSPQWVKDRKTGEILPVQFSNMGEAVIPGKGPADSKNYEFLRPMSFQDIGGGVMPFRYGSSTPEGLIPKTLPPEQTPTVKGRQAAASASGKIQGERDTAAVYDYPTVAANAHQAISHIDAMINHPGLEYAVGGSSVLPVIPGTPAADYMTRLDQLQGGVFLEAYKSLKGGGQITEVEGKKAEQALARLSRAQTEKEHMAALKEYRDIIYRGLVRARKAAKMGGVTMDDATPQKLQGWSIREK